jgi:hypothetical protein
MSGIIDPIPPIICAIASIDASRCSVRANLCDGAGYQDVIAEASEAS